MTDIKFSCPSCGQRIKCDRAHAGLRIPCPGCNVELEIPKVEAGAAEGDAVPQAQVVGKPAPKPGASPQPRTVVLKRKAPAPESDSDKGRRAEADKGSSSKHSPSPVAKPGRRPASERAKEAPGEGVKPAGPVPEEIRCLCPACRSELKVKTAPSSKVATGTLPLAELVRPGNRAPAPSAGALAEQTEPKVRRWSEMTAAENAEAGKGASTPRARPGGSLKPRLSYIMSGKPPAPPPRPDGTPRKKSKPKSKAPAASKSQEKPSPAETSPGEVPKES